MPKPFRWSVAKREQLGMLIADVGEPDVATSDLLPHLRAAAARILALADTADLAFIGRTPENLFDYLSGVFADIDGAPRLHLVHFSLRGAGPGGVSAIDPVKRKALMAYLREEGVDAPAIATRENPLALVDFVAHGGTMENFIKLLHLQTVEINADWPAVQRKLRIIGLRTQTHNSPNTYRWQQHQDWLGLIPDTVIKNVSAPAHFLYHLANDQAKVTASFHQGRWDHTEDEISPPSRRQQQALALAAGLYDAGQNPTERHALAGMLARKPQMRQAATRALVMRLKGL